MVNNLISCLYLSSSEDHTSGVCLLCVHACGMQYLLLWLHNRITQFIQRFYEISF